MCVRVSVFVCLCRNIDIRFCKKRNNTVIQEKATKKTIDKNLYCTYCVFFSFVVVASFFHEQKRDYNHADRRNDETIILQYGFNGYCTVTFGSVLFCFVSIALLLVIYLHASSFAIFITKDCWTKKKMIDEGTRRKEDVWGYNTTFVHDSMPWRGEAKSVCMYSVYSVQ